MSVRTMLASSLALLLLLGAGCTSIDGLSDAEATARAETAMESFAAAMSSYDGDDLRSVKGTMSGSSGDNEFGMEEFDSDFKMTWGKNDVVHFMIDAGSGGFSMQAEAWCTPTQMFLKWGNEIYESRPSEDASDEDLCATDGSEDEFTADAMLAGDEFADMATVEVEQLDDGTLRATYYDAEENMTVLALIDTKGRITQMEMDSPEMTGTFEVDYGARDTVTLPEPSARIPATVWSSETTMDNTLEGTVRTSSERPPLEEMELHLVRSNFSADTPEKIAGIALTAAPGSDGDYQFTFDDVDGDGRLSENDTYSITGPEIGESYQIQAEFFDVWADGYANVNPMPGPGALLTLLGIVSLAFVLRRNR